MTKIAPSIWAADFMELRRDIRAMENAGADYLHCDVMDGMYVTTMSFGWKMVEAFRRETKLPLDVHLMIHAPERYIKEFAQAGADIITLHVEATLHLQRALADIRSCGAKAGAVLNPSTPLDILEYVLDDLDMVLLMSVNPGFSGEKFIPSSLEKIAVLRKMIDTRGLSVEIEVDGGIDEQNAQRVIDAGADVLVAGRSIFSAKDPKAVIDKLRGQK